MNEKLLMKNTHLMTLSSESQGNQPNPYGQEFTEHLGRFIDSWDRLNSENEDLRMQLQEFFEQWEKLPGEIENPQRLEKEATDPVALEAFIEAFKLAFQQARKSGAMANVWHAAGLGRNEVRVVSALSWFLDCHGNHGQEHHLCTAVLDQLSARISALTAQDQQARFSRFPTAHHLLDTNGHPRYRAITEVCPLGEAESRVDIEINGPDVLLFIEAKIDAAQGKDQLRRYLAVAEQKAANRHWGVVYLTRSGALPQGEEDRKNLIGISWRDIATAFRNHAKDSANPARGYIKMFADFALSL